MLARYQATTGEPNFRVVVLTAEAGEGHAAAARALAAELVGERADVEVLVCDALVGLGRLPRFVLLDAYRFQLRFAPWIFGLLYRLFAHVPPLRGLGRAGLALLGARQLTVERAAGIGSARRVRPLVAAGFFEPCSRKQARRELALPLDTPVIVVSGGGWGWATSGARCGRACSCRRRSSSVSPGGASCSGGGSPRPTPERQELASSATATG